MFWFKIRMINFFLQLLESSFIDGFGDRNFFWKNGKIVTAGILKKICEFPVYSASNFEDTLHVTADAVLRQLPMDMVDRHKCYAYELNAPKKPDFYYSSVLDRHIVSVIMYEVPEGFPQELVSEEIRYDRSHLSIF